MFILTHRSSPLKPTSSPRSGLLQAFANDRPIAITSPTDSSPSQQRLGAFELLEREARDLGHDIVDRRLEARRRRAAVMSFSISSSV
jgi:hypothetical protein